MYCDGLWCFYGMQICPKKEVVPRGNELTIIQNQLENKFWSACTLLGSETRCSHFYKLEYMGDFWSFIGFNWYSLFLEFSIKWGNKLCSSNMQQMPSGSALRNSFSFSHQSLAHKVLFGLDMCPHVSDPPRSQWFFQKQFTLGNLSERLFYLDSSSHQWVSSQIPPTPTDNF